MQVKHSPREVSSSWLPAGSNAVAEGKSSGHVNAGEAKLKELEHQLGLTSNCIVIVTGNHMLAKVEWWLRTETHDRKFLVVATEDSEQLG